MRVAFALGGLALASAYAPSLAPSGSMLARPAISAPASGVPRFPGPRATRVYRVNGRTRILRQGTCARLPAPAGCASYAHVRACCLPQGAPFAARAVCSQKWAITWSTRRLPRALLISSAAHPSCASTRFRRRAPKPRSERIRRGHRGRGPCRHPY
jgi:hypothetical protein